MICENKKNLVIMSKKLYSTPTMAAFRGRFSPIEEASTRLANKASKEGPTKSGGNLTEKPPLAELNTASKAYYNLSDEYSFYYWSMINENITLCGQGQEFYR